MSTGVTSVWPTYGRTKDRNTVVLVAAATVMAAQTPPSPSAPIRVSRC